ncbi:MAG: tRNA-dihydrouridine synthase family protein, partial [Legionella longbeachae]|nr:tRNA-dihydrouridine synthase family protein [Legionella longbeachae]
MHAFINSSFKIGTLTLPNRLIQGPLAGYSCAPFRTLFNQYIPPAYCVTEMSSAQDILHKHLANSRYRYRAPEERLLAYQISGTEPFILAQAAQQLQLQGADIIDINCGCPKPKIRKKGAGSALLEKPKQLVEIINIVRAAITIPLTIKIRIQGNEKDVMLAKKIEEAGADALIVHGRRWIDDYDIASDFRQIANIKRELTIP